LDCLIWSLCLDTRFWKSCVGLFCLFIGACAAPATTLQTARSTPPGEIQAHVGAGMHLAPKVFSVLFQNAESAGKKARSYIEEGETPELTESEQNDLIESALAAAVVGPVPVTEVGLRVGLIEGLDVGASYTSAGFRVESKFQFLDTRHGHFADMSVGFQFFRQTTKPPVHEYVAKVFELEDIVRNDFWLPILLSREFDDIYLAYGGLKLGYSTLDVQILERLTDVSGKQISSGESMVQVGGVMGGGIGYKYIHVLAEVNILYYAYEVTLLERSIDISGLTFYPAMGIRAQFY